MQATRWLRQPHFMAHVKQAYRGDSSGSQMRQIVKPTSEIPRRQPHNVYEGVPGQRSQVRQTPGGETVRETEIQKRETVKPGQ